ncbi:MAG TPA: hypothetical protein VMU39_03915 [Solirubrobacteraceae bacterium]|nr:hypothetical protein [Solirubrobacteraceae bacterium]
MASNAERIPLLRVRTRSREERVSRATVPGRASSWIGLAAPYPVAKSWLLRSAIGSVLVLALVVFGGSMTGQHASVPELFTDIDATILVIGWVQVSPDRAQRWLTGERAEDSASDEAR